MTLRSCFVAHIYLLAAWCASIGCSRSDRPTTYPVEGALTYQGKPVAGATLDFLAPGASRSAIGTTDKNGRFRLTTFEPDDGAIVGTHVVTVLKTTAQTASTGAAPSENTPAAIEEAMEQSARQQRTARSAVPPKYADRKTSDLRIDVAPRKNDVQMNLVD